MHQTYLSQIWWVFFIYSLSVDSTWAMPIASHLLKDSKSIDPNTQIRVLITKQFSNISISGEGDSLYIRSKRSRWKAIGPAAEIAIWKRSTKSFLSINNQRYKATSFQLRPHHPGDRIKLLGKRFRGTLNIYVKGSKLWITNQLGIENYLKGSLAAEMSAGWNMEALKAQAVASRTYALHMKKYPKHKLYDLSNTIRDQVYKGANAENPRTLAAIALTKHEYLSFKLRPIKAFFHSRCGGKTESPSQVWGIKNRVGKGVFCPYCRRNPYRWKAKFSHEKILSALRIKPAKSHTLRIRTKRQSPSGRIHSLWVGPPGLETLLPADSLRKALGYTKLKSTYFRWQKKKSHIEFQGVGSGHGVGMCQWGAGYLARTGKTYRQILAHYYPKAKLD